jgi:hypothetical protein
MLIVLQAWA